MKHLKSSESVCIDSTHLFECLYKLDIMPGPEYKIYLNLVFILEVSF